MNEAGGILQKGPLRKRGNALRELRAAVGMTMKEVGRYSGLSESAISLFETGKQDLSTEALVRLQATFDGLTRDSRQLELQYLRKHGSKEELLRMISTQQRDISLLREKVASLEGQKSQDIGPLLAEAQKLWMERNLKPVTEQLAEVQRELVDLQRLVALKTDAIGSEAQAQDLQEQIEQRTRKGK